MQLRPSTYNELVEISGPYFITKSLGFDGAVELACLINTESWFKPRQLQNQI